MPSSRLSSYISKVDTDSKTVKWITWVIREITGCIFIFSGFVKAIDPWGTLYKVNDYLAAMGLDILQSLVIVGVFALCAVEFAVGVMICMGCFRRSAAWSGLAIMMFMLPLSLWIAMSDPVPDCGCFGDALIISNWATFWKNVALFVMVAWLVPFNRKIGWLVTPAIQWIALVATGLYVIVVSTAGYLYQPLIDFRQYKTGSPLTDSGINPPETEFKFIYERDGERREFTADDTLPSEDDGWFFIGREQIDNGVDSRVSVKDEKAFRLWYDGEDVTEDMLDSSGRQLLLLMPDLGNVSIATTWKINSLYDWASKHDISMIAAVAGSTEELENWEDLSMPDYEIYTADDTAIKEVARGNPAVVYTDNGIIRWKSSLRALDVDDFMSPETSADPMSFAIDNTKLLTNLTYLYLAILAVLVGFSFSTKLRNPFRAFRGTAKTGYAGSSTDNNPTDPKRGDTVRPEE